MDFELWDKIKEFELDDPNSAFCFSQRLARENNWSIEYTIRTIHEYKKFIYMLCIAEHSLTPSDQVDQVWHLHLIYTQSYWKEMCQDILKREIHHGPTKGGNTESEKYSDLYEKTLLLYQREFQREAPSDIWPSSSKRFKMLRFQRINRGLYWLIKKPLLYKK